ncbi:MAG: hypothetical protein M3063_02435 [Actinomycetota bacterium]|nr:hypothetical protein [Actinomycetota bacterium]
MLGDVIPLLPLRGSRPQEALILGRDITAIKKRERKLAWTETLWRAAFQLAPVAIA